MSHKTFDYIIIGAGASGLQLALTFLRDSYFEDKKILILEKKEELKNDKTWCYWEEEKGLYDNILYNSWKEGYFKSLGKTVNFDMKNYSYKMIRSIDFYNYAYELIQKSSNIKIIKEEILKTENTSKGVEVSGKKNNYFAYHIFDSRLPEDFTPKGSINILQHFKGWVVETEEEVFNPKSFCMMDYNHFDPDETAFMYILPFSKTKALLEYTYFTPQLVKEEAYEKHIKLYLKDALKVESYKILEIETGIIPMTSFPFYKTNKKNITKIGTSGGWVKASTGYSFKKSQENSLKIIENIKSGLKPNHGLHSARFKHYDKIFLEVLYNHNDYGKKLFYKMYSRNCITEIFRFLDEKSTLFREIKMMITMTSPKFIITFLKHAIGGFKIK